MKTQDLWHYPRTDLAQSVMNTLNSNIVHALTLFAPRRMGKTEFLRKDIMPLAQSMGYRVFYFSFLDGVSEVIEERFIEALQIFAIDSGYIHKGVSKLKETLKSVQVAGTGFELQETDKNYKQTNISQILSQLAESDKPTLLLLDEIQELVNIQQASGLVASLRTGLDMNKDAIKVIFTGSSRNGLLAMFDDARAPFFHFSTNLDLPVLDDGFVSHLALVYEQITGKTISISELIMAFNDLGRVPMQMRALLKEVILDPTHNLDEARLKLGNSLASGQNYGAMWQGLKTLDRAVIQYMAQGGQTPYAQEVRHLLAQMTGMDAVSTQAVQTSIRRLTRQNHLTKNAHGDLVISEQSLVRWVQQMQDKTKTD